MAAANKKRLDQESLAEVTKQLRKYLFHHYRAIKHEHDDLVQETLADLVEYIAGAAVGPSDADVRSIANVILKRRVADRYRKTSVAIFDSLQQTDYEALPSQKTDVEKTVRLRALLLLTISIINQWSESEQKLLLHAELEQTGHGRPLADSERKRLSRLRQRLRELLRARLGAEPKEYLE